MRLMTAKVLTAVTLGLGALHAQETPNSNQAQKNSEENSTPEETRPAATQPRIQPELHGKLRQSPDGRVYVTILLEVSIEPGDNEEKARRRTAGAYDKLLKTLSRDEFELDYRFQEPALVVGYVTVAGLEELDKNHAVKRVAVSKIEPPVIAELKHNPEERPWVIVLLNEAQGHGKPLWEQKKIVREHQRKVLDRLPPDHIDVKSRFSYVEAFSARVSARVLGILATDPDVRGVSLNMTFKYDVPQPRKMVPPSGAEAPRVDRDRQIALNNSIPMLGVDVIHDMGYTGDGITVAVLDSGVDCDAPWLFIDCVGGAGFIGGQSVDPSDDPPPHGPHGTIAAAIIAGVNLPFIGVAPDARMLQFSHLQCG